MTHTASNAGKTCADVANALRFKPRNTMGFFHVALASGFTIIALLLSRSPNQSAWLFSQMILALAFLQWFILLHEAGHQTLFRNRTLNTITGYVAGSLALIPYQSWYRIHARHHRWTGWQDKDATTESLVPRPLAEWERWTMRVAWKFYFPLFAIVYRLTNFWFLARVKRFTPTATHTRIALNLSAMLVAYALLIVIVGFPALLTSCGLGLYLSLMLQEPIILSQHTHIPQHLGGGRDVLPFPARDQAQFTRSLGVPKWFSALILHFDAHELHHHYPYVPGYDLPKLPAPTNVPIHWLTWVRAIKSVPVEVFMFQNRNQSGLSV